MAPDIPLNTDADNCLIQDFQLLELSDPDAVGFLERRSNLSGWYKYWFSLKGSQLLYFERGHSGRRGLLIDTISLFGHKLVLINSIKRRREFEVSETSGKVHVFRAESDAEMHWWVQLFDQARRKIPPAQPIDLSLGKPNPAEGRTPMVHDLPISHVASHLKVDHVLCVVHGIGVSSDILASNIHSLREGYREIMDKVFPDIEFRIELLVIHWRNALTSLDVQRRLQAVVPVPPAEDEPNPLRQFMVHRIVDYVYYTHERYRRHILREISSQLNSQIESFRLRHPEFDGQISVMGHSLGAALCYDLMCRKVHDDQVLLEAEGMRLSFDATNLFCLGNPLGTFLGLDPTIGLGADMRKLPFRIFNVFKYHDPLATRLEPHHDLSAVDVRPVTVPCWFNMGLRESTAQWLGTLWPGGKRKGPEAADAKSAGDNRNGAIVVTNGRKCLDSGDATMKGTGGQNEGVHSSTEGGARDRQRGRRSRASDSHLHMGFQHGPELERRRNRSSGDVGAICDTTAVAEVRREVVRIDFALQASSTMEDVSTSWSALKAHTEYWGNRDAMLLMVSTMMKSSFRLEGRVAGLRARGLRQRVVDKDVLFKNCGRSAGMDGGIDAGVGAGTAVDDSLRGLVEILVERLVDEAVGMQEVSRAHGEVKLQCDGMPSKSAVEGAEVAEAGKVESAAVVGAEAGLNGDSGGGRGWASYLGRSWFGSEGRSKVAEQPDVGPAVSSLVQSKLPGL